MASNRHGLSHLSLKPHLCRLMSRSWRFEKLGWPPIFVAWVTLSLKSHLCRLMSQSWRLDGLLWSNLHCLSHPITETSPLSTDEPVLKVGACRMASNLHLPSHFHDSLPGLRQAESWERAGVAQSHRVTRHWQKLLVSPRNITIVHTFRQKETVIEHELKCEVPVHS